MAKWWCTELQRRVIDTCVQLHGGYGYMLEYPIARAYADARVTTIYGGTTEIMKEIIGQVPRRLTVVPEVIGSASPSRRFGVSAYGTPRLDLVGAEPIASRTRSGSPAEKPETHRAGVVARWHTPRPAHVRPARRRTATAPSLRGPLLRRARRSRRRSLTRLCQRRPSASSTIWASSTRHQRHRPRWRGPATAPAAVGLGARRRQAPRTGDRSSSLAGGT